MSDSLDDLLGDEPDYNHGPVFVHDGLFFVDGCAKIERMACDRRLSVEDQEWLLELPMGCLKVCRWSKTGFGRMITRGDLDRLLRIAERLDVQLTP